MHAIDFLPILSTSSLLFCTLTTVQLGEILHAQLQPWSLVAIPSSFRVVNYMDLGPPCDRLENSLHGSSDLNYNFLSWNVLPW